MVATVYETREPRLGEILEIRVGDLRPSQPDDGRLPLWAGKPIESFRDSGEWFVLHGNHRYYQALKDCGGQARIDIRVSKNPYLG